MTGLELVRTKTIADGDDICDFRYVGDDFGEHVATLHNIRLHSKFSDFAIAEALDSQEPHGADDH